MKNTPSAAGFAILLLLLSGLGCQSRQARIEMEHVARVLSNGASTPRLGLWVPNTLLAMTVSGDESHSRIQLRVSEDGGDTFGNPVPISTPGAEIRTGGENSPVLFTDIQGDIYAGWFETDKNGSPQFMVGRSANFGRSFEQPVNIIDKDRKSSGYAGFPTIAASPKGDVYVAWLDERDPPQPGGTSSVYFARSGDHGATFSRNMRIAGAACPCCRPQLYVGSNGEIYLAWRKVFEGDVRDMVIAKSMDGGKSFSPPVRVATDDWVLHACPDTGPAVIVNQGHVYVAWYSEGQTKPGIRLAVSDDDGTSFHSLKFLSDEIVDANHPRLSVSEDGRVLLAFQGRPAQEAKRWRSNQAFLIEINGTRATKPVQVTDSDGSVSHPDVIAGTAGRVFMAWSASEQDSSQALVSRGWMK